MKNPALTAANHRLTLSKTTAISLAIASVIISACSPPMRPVEAQTHTEIVDSPAIGAEEQRELGDTLLAKGRIETKEILGVELQTDLVGKRFGVVTRIPKQTVIARAQDSDWTYFSAIGVITDYPIRQDTVGNGGLVVAQSDPHWVEIYGTDGPEDAAQIDCPPWFEVKHITQKSENDPSFKQELIYDGRVGNRVSFLYREFVGGLARPAFSQEVTYDLAEGKEIGFKGARLEILNANNQTIRYRVLKSFPDQGTEPAASSSSSP